MFSKMMGEFPGSPVVRTQCFRCQGLNLIPGQKIKILQVKKKKKVEESGEKGLGWGLWNLGLQGGRWGRSKQPLHLNRREILIRTFRSHDSFPFFVCVTGKGEDSDVLSINADAYDSDIEGPCNEEAAAPEVPENTVQSEAGQIDDLEKDIEKSVNEILGLAESSPKEPKAATLTVPPPEDVQPSAQQLELLELEMRARAIKALMKAGDIKKPA